MAARRSLRLDRAVLAAACALAGPAAALAVDCTTLGLVPRSGLVMQLREAGQPEQTALVYQARPQADWFLPLQGAGIGQAQPGRLACSHGGTDYWRIPDNDPALRLDAETDLLVFLDANRANGVIDARQQTRVVPAEALDSLGVNYQLALNYQRQPGLGVTRSLMPSVLTEFYGRRAGWYFNSTVGWSDYGRIARYDTYALKEWLDTGTVLRLGDAISGPTAVGESLQFAGMSIGTDRSLRPGDFSPVLPTLRNGNALAGPLEVFINDNLQFQQTLQNGVYDLRNIPAQQGFNSYSVRTLDAQGNPVTVRREIYLPASLLPAGVSSWRVDAGWQRRNYFTSNWDYSAPFASASYARGLTENNTVEVQGLVSRAASSVSGGYDQRLSDLWTGRVGLVAARNNRARGQAMQWRAEGGSRAWRLLFDVTEAFNALPGLGDRASLLSQRLAQAQWYGVPDWTFGLTLVQSQREGQARDEIATVSAATRVGGDASVNLMLSQVRSAGTRQDSVMVSAFLPLAPRTGGRYPSVFASQTAVEGSRLSRVQYNDNGPTVQDGSWTAGLTQDSRQDAPTFDGYWSRSIGSLDLLLSGRTSEQDSSALATLRSGLVWTGGNVFATRPINGAFAIVSTGIEGVDVFYESRRMGRTDAAGMLLVPELRPLETNRLSLDPVTWPIQWTAGDIDRQVVPPRGGGVLVSFRINAQVWPSQAMMLPRGPGGMTYPSGTVVTAEVDGQTREAVIDSRGQVWVAELLPAARFTIRQGGQRCDFELSAPDSEAPAERGKAPAPIALEPLNCQDGP